MAIDYGKFERGRGLNYWEHDPVLRSEVTRTYPGDREWAESQFDAFGEIIGETVADNSDTVDRHGPELCRYDRNGNRVDEIEYHPAQFENERLVYGVGAVADSFRAPPGRDERASILHHLTMDYLLAYADVGLTCPVAMTAGVALVLDRFEGGTDGEFADTFERLTTRNHDDLLQGAMFLTERQGGSDVGATETVAVRAGDPSGDGGVESWQLTGEKWFCSNVDSGAILTLARRPDAPPGTDGLSLFLVEEDADYRIRRLKDKLGTISVPTAEVEFDATDARLVGDPEDGFRQMSEMLNLERLANAFGACGLVGRALLESKIRAANREAFGETIDQYPLMRRDLVEMAVAHEAATAFTFDAGRAFDRYRDGDDDAFALMRLLVPIAKYRTGRLAVDTASYAMEIHGGNGYVNDFVTNRLLRDGQVLPIWEGTSNVLSLDVLRTLAREDAHEPALVRIRERLDRVESPDLADAAATTRDELAGLEEALLALATSDDDVAQLHAKELADYVFDVYTAALLLSKAESGLADGDDRSALVARQFVAAELEERSARGIPEQQLSLDAFEKIVRLA